MAKGNRGGKRNSSLTKKLSSEQNRLMNNLKNLAQKYNYQNLTFTLQNDGDLDYSYQVTKTVVEAHAGKMVDPNKDKFYDVIENYTGTIKANGLKVKGKTSKTKNYIGTRKQVYKQSGVT